ncbi:MAG: hypothetical protein ACTSUY_05055 [Alphaproteobacteria bacterium]
MTNDTPQAAETQGPPARGLKLTVIIMGVLLIIGFAVVLTTIVYRAATPGDEAKSAIRTRGAFGVVEVSIPTGSQVVETDLRGERALVRLQGAGATELLVLDIKRGIVLGRFRLEPNPK